MNFIREFDEIHLVVSFRLGTMYLGRNHLLICENLKSRSITVLYTRIGIVDFGKVIWRFPVGKASGQIRLHILNGHQYCFCGEWLGV